MEVPRQESAVPPAESEAFRQARDQFNQGNYRAAESIYQAILASHLDDAKSLSNLGVVRFRLGEFESAEALLRRAISLSPNDAFSYSTLGIICYAQGKRKEAVEALRRASALYPQDPLIQETLGRPSNVGDFLTPLEETRLLTPSPSA